MNNDRNNDRYGDSQNRQQQNPDNDNNWRDERQNMSPSDNDDFNNQGWPEDDDRDIHSRTFNENEATYDDEQRAGTNAGTRNNNWDANDPTQRTSHIHDDEQWDRPNQPYDSGSGL